MTAAKFDVGLWISWGRDSSGFRRAFIQELRARDDALDEAGKTIAVFRKSCTHRVEQGIIGRNQRSAETVSEELPAEVIQEIILSMFANVAAQSFQTFAFGSTGELRARVDGPASEVQLAQFTYRPVPFEN